MTTAERVNRIVDLFWRLLTAIVMTAFALMLVILAIQVVSRYALGIAVSWTDEASRYLFMVEIFLGSVLALRYQEHIKITLLTDIMGPRLRHISACAADVVCILVLLMLLLGSWNMMQRTTGVLASTFRMSFSYMYLLLVISSILMTGLLIGDLYRRLFVKLPSLHGNRSD